MIARDNSSASSAQAAAFSEAQQQMLAVILAMAIPASADGRLPAGDTVGLPAFAVQAGAQDWLAAGLAQLVELAQQQYGMAFAQLGAAQQQELVNGARRKQFRFFGDLTSLLMQCYYQHDAVLQAIGLEARPPFPLGYAVQDGDLSLLEVVYERGPIYRSTEPNTGS